MKVKKNDTVVVLTGKDVKKTGKVLMAMPKSNKIVVEGVNVQEKNHKARSAQDTSSKIKREGPIDASNVLVICPKCGKATRVGHKIVDDKKVRICKKCGESLDVKVVADAKAAKKPVAKKATKKAAVNDEAVKEAPVAEETKAVKKTTKTTKTTKTAAKKEVAEGEKEVKKASTRKKTAKTEEKDAE